MSGWPDRILVALGGLAGLCGVALAAMAAHVTGGGNLETAARFLLLHAPALLAIPALAQAGLAHRGLARAAGYLMALGLVLFCGDLAVRAVWGVAPLRLAAPAGGVLLMLAWGGLGLAGLVGARERG